MAANLLRFEVPGVRGVIKKKNHILRSIQYLKLRRLFRRILRDDLVARQKGLLALNCSFESLLVATAREENRLCVIYFSMLDRKANGAWMFRS